MTALPIYYKKVWIKAIVRLESVESFHPGRSRINLYLFAYMQKRTRDFWSATVLGPERARAALRAV